MKTFSIKLIRTFLLICLLTGFSQSLFSQSKKVIILSIDGGGIKGVIPATFLQLIEEETNKQTYQLFDIIGGTSTGGIICTAVVSKDSTTNLPYTASRIVDMYTQDGHKLFLPQHRKKKLFKAKYYAECDGQGIEPYLQSAFGKTTTLSDSYSFIKNLEGARLSQMFTTSYLLNSTGKAIKDPEEGRDYGPYLFSWDVANSNADEDYYVWEAARGTSSAPVFFPIAHVGGGEGGRSDALEKWVVDGGTMSNNPAIWALAQAFEFNLATQLEEIVVISIGCGFNPGSAGVGITDEGWTVPDDGNWGEFYWVIDKLYDLEGNVNQGGTIVNLMLESVQMAPDNQLRDLANVLPIEYIRLEPTLPASLTQMDNTSPENIDALVKVANDFIKGEGKADFEKILQYLK